MLARLVVGLSPIGTQSIAEPIIQNVAMFLAISLGLWVWRRLLSKRPFWTLGLERQPALRRALRGVLIAGLMMAATAGLSIAPGASLAPGLLQTRSILSIEPVLDFDFEMI